MCFVWLRGNGFGKGLVSWHRFLFHSSKKKPSPFRPLKIIFKEEFIFGCCYGICSHKGWSWWSLVYCVFMSAASLIVIWLCSKPCVLWSKCKAWVLYLFMGFLCRGRWQFECLCEDQMSDQERTGGLSLWNLTNTDVLSLIKDVESTLNHCDEQVKLTLSYFSLALLFSSGNWLSFS